MKPSVYQSIDMEKPIQRETMLKNPELWEKMTEEYELTLQCDGDTLIIMLDTQKDNFRCTLDRCQPDGAEQFLSYFPSLNSIFYSAQDSQTCRVDAEKGLLIFTTTITVAKEQAKKERILPLKKLEKVNYFLLMELMFRKVAKRQYLAEKGIREENIKIRNQLQGIKMQLNHQKNYIKQVQKKVEVPQELGKQSHANLIFGSRKQKNQNEFSIQNRMKRKMQDRKRKHSNSSENIQLLSSRGRSGIILSSRGKKKNQLSSGKDEKKQDRHCRKEEKRERKRLENRDSERNLQSNKQMENIIQKLEVTTEKITKSENALKKLSEKVMDMELKQIFWRKDKNKMTEIQEKHPQYLMGITIHNFKLNTNTIQLVKKVLINRLLSAQQLLINIAIRENLEFTVYTKVTKCNAIMVGVVDRFSQKEERSSAFSGNVVCYNGYKGHIYYGEGGESRKRNTNDTFCEGMEVRVKSNGGKITFTLIYPTKLVKVHEVSSQILLQPHRQFVPYIEMFHVGDIIEWEIKQFDEVDSLNSSFQINL